MNRKSQNELKMFHGACKGIRKVHILCSSKTEHRCCCHTAPQQERELSHRARESTVVRLCCALLIDEERSPSPRTRSQSTDELRVSPSKVKKKKRKKKRLVLLQVQVGNNPNCCHGCHAHNQSNLSGLRVGVCGECSVVD